MGPRDDLSATIDALGHRAIDARAQRAAARSVENAMPLPSGSRSGRVSIPVRFLDSTF